VPISYSFDFPGILSFKIGRDKFIKETSNFKDVFNRIADDFYSVEKKIFAAQGTPKRWAPLSFAYSEWKKKAFPGQPILRLKDILFKSLTTPNSPGSIREITNNSIRIGTSVPYAIMHQQDFPPGEIDKIKGLPRRPPIQITEKIKLKWIAMFGKELEIKMTNRIFPKSGFDR